MFQLVWNEGDPTSENRPEKLVKANYATQEEAYSQAELDLEFGKNIVGIVDEDGKFVWMAEDHAQDNMKLERSNNSSYPWRLSG